MKTCKHCNETKELTEFIANKESKDGYRNQCRLCWNIHKKEWAAKNKEKRAQSSQKYYWNNRDYYLGKGKEWLENNREWARSQVNARRKRVKQATPPWQSKQDFIPLYLEAQQKGLEVDHIVPINHPDVCGLHVPWNLQLLSHEENLSKGNRFYG